MGCLGPVEDPLDLSSRFGPPGDPVHIEDTTADVSAFPESFVYRWAYVEGERTWYWDIGPSPAFIAPVFIIEQLNGEAMGRPIIDVVPGDPGYTPWWRIVRVRVTESYAGERIWSRAAIDAGVRLGILEAPEPTSTVATCPVVKRQTRIDLGDGTRAAPTDVWFRDQLVSWYRFSDEVEVSPPDVVMPDFPVYQFQRSNQALILDELLTGVDMDGDGEFTNTNNVFSAGSGRPRHSPLWQVVRVRTLPGYESFDGGEPAIQAESDFLSFAGGQGTLIDGDVISVEPTGTLVGCPLQPERGRL